MAISLSVSERFVAPPETVFATLTDLKRAADWMPNLVRIERLERGPLVRGHTWRETRRMFGREATEHFEVIDLAPPQRLCLKVDGTQGSSGQGTYNFTYRLIPHGSGTHLTLTAEIEGLQGPMKVFARVLSRSYRKSCARDLAALRHYLDGSRRPG